MTSHPDREALAKELEAQMLEVLRRQTRDALDWGTLRKAVAALRDDLSRPCAPDATHDMVMRAIVDGFTNGNEQYDDLPPHRQMDYGNAADAVMQKLRAAGETIQESDEQSSTETRGGTGDDCSVGKRGVWPHHDDQVCDQRLNVGPEPDVTAGETAPYFPDVPPPHEVDFGIGCPMGRAITMLADAANEYGDAFGQFEHLSMRVTDRSRMIDEASYADLRASGGLEGQPPVGLSGSQKLEDRVFTCVRDAMHIEFGLHQPDSTLDSRSIARSKVARDYTKEIISLVEAAGDRAQRRTARELWYLGAMNDGLFIINRKPRPSTDDQWHDRPDGPTLVINVTSIPPATAQEIVAAHNAALPPEPAGLPGREAAEHALNWLYGEASALLAAQKHPEAEAFAYLRAALQKASDLLALSSPISGDGSSGYEIVKARGALPAPSATDAVDWEFDLKETLKAVLYHFGTDGAEKVTGHVMDARKTGRGLPLGPAFEAIVSSLNYDGQDTNGLTVGEIRRALGQSPVLTATEGK